MIAFLWPRRGLRLKYRALRLEFLTLVAAKAGNLRDRRRYEGLPHGLTPLSRSRLRSRSMTWALQPREAKLYS